MIHHGRPFVKSVAVIFPLCMSIYVERSYYVNEGRAPRFHKKVSAIDARCLRPPVRCQYLP